MENASKALTIAGGVLISLLVISLLVLFYNNLRSLESTKQGVDQEKMAAEFNSKFTTYERNAYGSDILSLINKVVDYNKREGDNAGYQKIEVYVELTKNLNSDFFKKKTYNSTQFKNEMDRLSQKVSQLGNITVKSQTTGKTKKISELANMRTSEIEDLGINQSQYITNVTQYNIYKSLSTEIKAKIFQFTKSDYDNNTGRVTGFYFKVN